MRRESLSSGHHKPRWILQWLCHAFLTAWIFVSGVTPASADPINVVDNGQKIGTVDFANYGVRYSYIDGTGRRITHSPPRQGPPLVNVDVAGGANFDATFNFTNCPPGTVLCRGAQFQWVQVVKTNAPQTNAVRGNAPSTGYIDPWSPPGGGTGQGGTGYEDLKPFYWTDAELADPDIGGNPGATDTLKFHDTSQRGFTSAADNDITWLADLNLVCTWDNLIHVLGYFEWGWTMPKGMATDFGKEIALNPKDVKWAAGASPGLSGILTSQREFGKGYAGDPNRPGWSLTDQSCCVAVPEPASVGLLSMGLLALLLAHKRRWSGAAQLSTHWSVPELRG